MSSFSPARSRSDRQWTSVPDGTSQSLLVPLVWVFTLFEPVAVVQHGIPMNTDKVGEAELVGHFCGIFDAVDLKLAWDIEAV